MLIATIAALKVWWPVIAAVLPSLIVGLTNAPSPTANKVGNTLKVILQYFSVVTHSDHDGTFKPPFTRSTGKLAPVPPAAVGLFILLAFVAAAPGDCHGPTKDAGPAATDATTPPSLVTTVIDCTVAAVQKTALDILPTVESILATGKWQTGLLGLVEKFGEAATDCAVQRVLNKAGNDAKLSKTDVLARSKASNAAMWLSGRNVTFK